MISGANECARANGCASVEGFLSELRKELRSELISGTLNKTARELYGENPGCAPTLEKFEEYFESLKISVTQELAVSKKKRINPISH